MEKTKKLHLSRFQEELLYLLLKIAAILLAMLVIFTLIFGAFRMTDASMAPALKEGDLIMFFRLDQDFAAGDLAVLSYDGTKEVRRVIAIEGDEVDITGDGLVINGALQSETEIYSETWRYDTGIDFPLTVPEGEVFLLGDSRENCTDSRVYGTVKATDIQGKVMAVLRRRNF
jgi:signal peptidase I